MRTAWWQPLETFLLPYRLFGLTVFLFASLLGCLGPTTSTYDSVLTAQLNGRSYRASETTFFDFSHAELTPSGTVESPLTDFEPTALRIDKLPTDQFFLLRDRTGEARAPWLLFRSATANDGLLCPYYFAADRPTNCESSPS